MNKCSISVRFWHPYQDLNFLEALLDMPCHKSWTAGTSRHTPRGDELPGTYDVSYWVSRLEYSAENGFMEQLALIVDRLEKLKDNLIAFRQFSGSIEIYMQFPGSVNNCDTIPSDILKSIGGLGIDLHLEVFPEA
jgi:hypothetical protein